jgi:hypothetical protein
MSFDPLPRRIPLRRSVAGVNALVAKIACNLHQLVAPFRYRYVASHGRAHKSGGGIAPNHPEDSIPIISASFRRLTLNPIKYIIGFKYK